ncbi:hypothetical protein [Marinilactibacillus psychrotolerans]|uniref:hypothetical protein n=1 Tax=Marinilactibacillus psychrotolerans TaxID=191770 RepID=UPI00388937E6
MGVFLDKSICYRFRESIGETKIFVYDEGLKNHYNLFCVVMDRLDSSIEYLNKNSKKPKTENDFLFFITHSCIVLDAVKQLFQSLNLTNTYTDINNANSYTYFKDTCTAYPRIFPEDKLPTDDKFFEYFRSLSMAHPFETSRPKFFKKNEIQYSPWIIVRSSFSELKDPVGARIYSNQFEDIQDLKFPFERLKGYINSRYLLIDEATEKIHQIVEEKRGIWKKNKIPRQLPPIQTLEEIKKRLKERYEETYTVDSALNCFKVQLTDINNQSIVLNYLKVIEDLLPSLIDTIDMLNHERSEDLLYSVLNTRPKSMHQMADYQLEKIFMYLDISDETSSNYHWGLEQAEDFAEGLGNKWVSINTDTMNAEEIKLLVRVACYFEKKEQLNN